MLTRLNVLRSLGYHSVSRYTSVQMCCQALTCSCSRAVGIFLLPDSPRYFVKRGRVEQARDTLGRLRGQPAHSELVEFELAEIIANADYERRAIPTDSWFGSWAACFSGSLFHASSNLRRTILGTSLQMMQQWTGVK